MAQSFAFKHGSGAGQLYAGHGSGAGQGGAGGHSRHNPALTLTFGDIHGGHFSLGGNVLVNGVFTGNLDQ